MIVEKAFFNLPEIMLGSGYVKQEYEASIVTAYSLAVLQELNSRNIQNPIAKITAERKYNEISNEVDPSFRYDLDISLKDTFLGNDNIYRYGFRFKNCVEAKYFRTSNNGKPTTKNVVLLLKDIYRIIFFTLSNNNDKKDGIGRYLLHMYKGKVETRLSLNRNQNNKEKRVKRTWIELMISPGVHSITESDFSLEKETAKEFKMFPKNIIIKKLNITNYVIDNTFTEGKSTHDDYVFVLTRINYFTVSYKNGNKDDDIELTPDGLTKISSKGALKTIKANLSKSFSEK